MYYMAVTIIAISCKESFPRHSLFMVTNANIFFAIIIYNDFFIWINCSYIPSCCGRRAYNRVYIDDMDSNISNIITDCSAYIGM